MSYEWSDVDYMKTIGFAGRTWNLGFGMEEHQSIL